MRLATQRGFSALQRAENSSNDRTAAAADRTGEFQCSSASRKFLKVISYPQRYNFDLCFSALQRAENSSKLHRQSRQQLDDVFQCSSASRKFLKSAALAGANDAQRFQCSSASRKFLKGDLQYSRVRQSPGFSALQRAENSSKDGEIAKALDEIGFSALQRAENSSNTARRRHSTRLDRSFSALQRAENSSNVSTTR